jgi:type I restriction enzyme S subunit
MFLTATRSKLTEEGAGYTRILEPGTLLLTNSGATLGVPKINRLRAGANDGIAAFLGIKGARKEFLYYFLETQTRFFRERLAPGVGQPNLNTELIGSVPVTLPQDGEQRVIAAVLQVWDGAIAVMDALLRAHGERKRGLMQRLLAGKTRFKEFVRGTQRVDTRYGRFPADWAAVHVGDIADEVGEKNGGGHELPVLSCTKDRGLVDSLEYFGKRVFSADTNSYKVVRRGDFAYATNHVEEGSIGYQGLHDAALISPMYTVFRTRAGVDHSFFFKLVKTELYRHIFEVNTSGSIARRGGLRWDEFAIIKVFLPSMPEQKRIAAVLDVCDREIELLQKQLAALKEQKRGLMQKLLTGEVRVKV